MDQKHTDAARLMHEIDIGFEQAEQREWLESLLQMPLLSLDELNLEIPTHDMDPFILSSEKTERHENTLEFDDSWLNALTDDESGILEESCTIKQELASPEVIKAPLRSVRPDKRSSKKT